MANTSNIPQSLIDALQANEVVPFIGAGVSRSIEKEDGSSLFPTWKEFLLKGADKLDKENKSSKAAIVRSLLEDIPPDYLEAAQRTHDYLGQKQWYNLLKESFEIDLDSANENSLELARLIWELGSNLLVTTNVDLVLQSAHESPQKVKILDTQAPEFAELQRDWKPLRPTVLHLHGHIDNKANVIFTRAQYNAFYDLEKNKAKLETLRTLFAQRTILFIGFSLDDLFILKELERVNLIYEGGANSFYILIREAEKDNPNIPGYVHTISFANFDEPLLDLVKNLTLCAVSPVSDDLENTALNSNLPPPKVFFNVPYESKGKEFVGRIGKIDQIWNLMSQSGCAPIGQAVNITAALGGLGKTQLAVEYAHANQARYKNGVFWLIADENIDNQIIQIADKQNWINQYDKTVNQLERAKKRFLQLSDCLIIFDNVEKYSDIKNYLPRTNLQTHILSTSRWEISEFRSIDLEFLKREESRELLLKVSNREGFSENENDYLKNILSFLGDVPLAIELVGSYLAEHENVSFSRYYQFLNDVPLEKLEKKFPEGSFTKHDRSIIRTLQISEKLIKEKPFMVEILKVLAWSGNASMGSSLLKTLVSANDEFEFENAIGDGHRLRLLKKDEIVERYAIHRLLAKVIRYENPLDTEREWYQKIVDNLEFWFDNRKELLIDLPDFEAEIEHLEEWRNHIYNLFPEKAVRLIALQAYPLNLRGNYKKSLEYIEKAFALYRTQHTENKQLLAALQNDTGTLYFQLGRYSEAMSCFIEALEIRKEVFGNEHKDTAITLSDIGNVYSELGNNQEALKCGLEALEIRQKLFGDKHFHTAMSLHNVGTIYIKLGKYEDALRYLIQSLDINKEIFGETSPNIALTLTSIGGVYDESGKPAEALQYHLQSLKIWRNILGENHPGTSNSLNNVGATYNKLHNYKEALKHLQSALDSCRENFDNQHPYSIICAGNLVTSYLSLGQFEKAGRLAAEFLNYVPINHPKRMFFEKIGGPYRKVIHPKKRGKK